MTPERGRVESDLTAIGLSPHFSPSLKLIESVLMYSLFYVLNNQHGEEFAPVRCNEQTLVRLVRYFEDVVTENKLEALMIQGRCPNDPSGRDVERAAKLAAIAHHLYIFSCDRQCKARAWQPEELENVTVLEERDYHKFESGPFILVMEPRFSGLLAACEVVEDGNTLAGTYEIVWTFDPNVVFTALEYLMARLGVQKPMERMHLETLMNNCTPRRSSLRLALTFTTKLAMLMQRQNELEMATNRISSAISSTLDLEPMLQSAVDEVGHALKARRSALVLWHEGTSKPESMSIFERPNDSSEGEADHLGGFSEGTKTEDLPADVLIKAGPLEVPITYRNSVIGVLVVEDDRLGRDWENEEVLMVKTVADQLAIAISHARLFRQVQTQAMTDALTGLYNHRYFQERLDRETKLADRNNAEVSLILLDLDHLKRINDTHGHRAGDAALCHVARMMQATVREVDVCARYGGEEFVIVLPQCGRDDAINVAERLREAIASNPVKRIGQITASIGVATYPTAAKTIEELIEMADRAMYLAKAAGRNRVRTLMHRNISRINI